MWLVTRLGLCVPLALPGVLLIALSIAPLHDGVAVDSAIPFPIYMIRQLPLPKATYWQASYALRGANAADGQAKIFAAEAALSGGAIPASQVATLESAIANDPANARGWMVLSDAYYSTNKDKAAAALSQSMLLAPYNFWFAEPQAARAAQLWAQLDSDGRASAMRQTLLLWEEPQLRPAMRLLLKTPQGVELVRQAFQGSQDELRQMNRWLSAQRRHDAQAQ